MINLFIILFYPDLPANEYVDTLWFKQTFFVYNEPNSLSRGTCIELAVIQRTFSASD